MESTIVPDLTISETKLKNSFNIFNNDNVIQQNYFSLIKLKMHISKCDLINNMQIYDTIIEEICLYHGIIGWSKMNKSNNINVVASTDRKINYAFLTPQAIDYIIPKFSNIETIENDDNNTILFDYWIDLQSNSIYRYIFRYFVSKDCQLTNYNALNEEIKDSFKIHIGFVNKQSQIQYCSKKSTDAIGWDNYDWGDTSLFGSLWRSNSFAWISDGINAYFGIDCGVCEKTKIDWSAKNYYFMIEINGASKSMNVYCNALQNNKKYMIFDIPNRFWNQSMRLGMTLQTNNVLKGNVGVGLVKL